MKHSVNVFPSDGSVTNEEGTEETAGYQTMEMAEGSHLIFASEQYGSNASVQLNVDNEALATAWILCYCNLIVLYLNIVRNRK